MIVRRAFQGSLATSIVGMAGRGSGSAADAGVDYHDAYVNRDATLPRDASCPDGGYETSWDALSPAGPTLAELRSFVAGAWRGSLAWQLPDPQEIQVTGIASGQTQLELSLGADFRYLAVVGSAYENALAGFATAGLRF